MRVSVNKTVDVRLGVCVVRVSEDRRGISSTLQHPHGDPEECWLELNSRCKATKIAGKNAES